MAAMMERRLLVTKGLLNLTDSALVVTIDSVEIGSGERTGGDSEVRWLYLRRTQRTLVRGSRPRQFYPIYIDQSTT
jgi:adenine-specific DNA-methyltransferase